MNKEIVRKSFCVLNPTRLITENDHMFAFMIFGFRLIVHQSCASHRMDLGISGVHIMTNGSLRTLFQNLQERGVA